jgi:succinyl-CoA synthetase beta subunit
VVNGRTKGHTISSSMRAAGQPNFMDIRTTATSLDIAHGFALILKNPAVKSIFVNVHGGDAALRHDRGISPRRSGRRVPIVIRMAGNNAAAETVQEQRNEYIDADDMAEGAAAAVSAARRRLHGLFSLSRN